MSAFSMMFRGKPSRRQQRRATAELTTLEGRALLSRFGACPLGEPPAEVGVPTGTRVCDGSGPEVTPGKNPGLFQGRTTGATNPVRQQDRLRDCDATATSTRLQTRTRSRLHQVEPAQASAASTEAPAADRLRLRLQTHRKV